MPSPAAIQFTRLTERSRTLARLGQDVRLRPIPRDEAQICYHAALAGFVAAWDTYVKKISENFLATISDPTNPKLVAVHSLLDGQLTLTLKKFNTPNFEKSRELLRAYTGYEPINDWVWPARQMNGVAVRTRLDEILKVRHSFAHGFAMPAYPWNTSPRGSARLTAQVVRDVELFITNLVIRTDRGIASHISATYGIAAPW